MSLTVIPGGGTPANPPTGQVIHLTAVRNFHSTRVCPHLHLSVDPEKAFVECKDCQEKLNPMAVLSRFAKEESRWSIERQSMNETIKKLQEKSRCKCEHCGKMTRIPP